ncbi:MAG: ChbG/HpnK family deacetylase, partial [Deltaproteobacteria bacterium]
MKYLIVNADDFGLSDYVNEGIIKAHKAGAIT